MEEATTRIWLTYCKINLKALNFVNLSANLDLFGS